MIISIFTIERTVPSKDDWSDWNAGWLSGVASKGTITVFKDFYQTYNLEIPEGWTIILQE